MSEESYRRRFLMAVTGAGAGAATLSWAAGAPAPGSSAPSGIHTVTSHGAAGDGKQRDTAAIQSAIDECSRAGGGIVDFPPGVYLSGGLILKSHVHLYLDAGATLLGSRRLDDFPVTIPTIRSYTDNYTERSLIYAENCNDIGIHGEGVLDGQGAAFEGPYKVRPYMIRIIRSKDVSVTGVTIRDSPMWVQHYLACDNVTIHAITVNSRVNHNNDGIDIDCCHRVTISDCNIWSGDDAIVLKSTSDRLTTDVAVTNCLLSTNCNALKLGTETNGGFQNIVVSNCSIYDTKLSGLTFQMVDGGVLDGVSVSNIIMRNVRNPIFIRLGNRARPFEKGGAKPPVGKLRNLRISNVNATGASRTGCAISGIPGHEIENVSIENVRIVSAGRVSRSEIPADPPERETAYPEHEMFGMLPAYGFFCRHVNNLRFHNVETEFAEADARPAIACRDVRELEISNSVLAGTDPAIRLRNVRDAMIHGCRVRSAAKTFVGLFGARTTGVSLIGNDLAKARHAVTGGEAFLAANRTSGGNR